MQSPTTAAIAYMISGSAGHVSAPPDVKRHAASDGGSPGIVFMDVRFPGAGWITHEVTGLEVAVHTRPAHVRHEVDYEIAVRISERENLIVRRPGLQGTSRWNGAFASRVLSFSAAAVERIAELPIGKVSFAAEGAALRARKSTHRILRALTSVYEEDPTPDRLLIESLHIAALRSVMADQPAVRTAATALSSPQTNRACAYIKDHLAGDITVVDLARVLGVSEGHFIRAFRQTVGVTPYQYIMRERVAAAEALIQAGKMPMAQVAELAGFTSASAMSRTFRKYRGHSPTGR